MFSLESVEKLVQNVPCPVCMNSRFEVNLSCDLAHSPCDFQAVCGYCHYKFAITRDTCTLAEVWEKARQEVNGRACPLCGDSKINLEFLCDVASEDCFFLIRCADNGHYSRFGPQGIQYLFH